MLTSRIVLLLKAMKEGNQRVVCLTSRIVLLKAMKKGN